jgi:hypothetical protein
MDTRICVSLFCICVVLCVGSGLATGRSPVKGVLPTVYRIKKLKQRPRPTRTVYRAVGRSVNIYYKIIKFLVRTLSPFSGFEVSFVGSLCSVSQKSVGR